MGLLTWLGFGRATDGSFAPTGVASPWADTSQLVNVTLANLFDVDELPVNRAEAMSLPSVSKGRALICGLSRQPLVALKDGVVLEDQPTWLFRTDSGVGPRLRMLWTLDDLIFYGWSLWAVQRGADAQILDAQRVPFERWTFDSDGNVLVDNQPVSAASVLLIPGPDEGLLTKARRTIRGGTDLEGAWQSRVSMPLPTTEIRFSGDANDQPTLEEMRDIRDQYVAARKDPNGAVMVTPAGFEIHTHSADGFDLFDVGRNSRDLDVARHLNVPAIMIDASNINASSVNYQNQNLGRSLFVDETLRYWAMPIEERLSQDDVVPRGTYVEFDLSDFTVPDDGTQPDLRD